MRGKSEVAVERVEMVEVSRERVEFSVLTEDWSWLEVVDMVRM